jgi:type I restriction enzyme M protein
MSDSTQQQLGNSLWAIADKLRGAMNADDFCYEVLIFLFSRDPFIKEFIHLDVDP